MKVAVSLSIDRIFDGTVKISRFILDNKGFEKGFSL